MCTISFQRRMASDEFHGGQLLCTGQRPNTDLMQDLLPGSIVPEGPSKGMIRVLRTLQVGIPARKAAALSDELGKLSLSGSSDAQATADVALDAPYPHIFAVGDAADTFGAINAGHTAAFQVIDFVLGW